MIDHYSMRSQYSGFWDTLTTILNPAATVAEAVNAPPVIQTVLSPTQALVEGQNVQGGLDRNPRASREGLAARGMAFQRWARQRRGGGQSSGSSQQQGSQGGQGGGQLTSTPSGGWPKGQGPAVPSGVLPGPAAAAVPATAATPWGWILGGIGVVLLIGGGIWFATRKKRRGRR